MFTKPIDDIEFEDVKSFCEQWAEGVRVEYKSEITVNRHIPKIVSSFANTYGGIFLIGVEADQKNNRVNAIPGIPQQNGIEEQIQQSALTGIYPGVMPEIQLVGVPDTDKVVVVVRVDESVQAPHAIQNSTRTYIRTGSITNPYELADMDRIAYMFKRREDSQVIARHIFDRIEERIGHLLPLNIPIEGSLILLRYIPMLTVIARPVFPYRPLTSVSNIYKLHPGLFGNTRRVTGGHFSYNEGVYWELNEYGIVYHRNILSGAGENGFDYGRYLWGIIELIERANALYVDCGYMGNIEVTVQLQHVYGKKLQDTDNDAITRYLGAVPVSHDSEIIVSKNCLARDLQGKNDQKNLVEELTCPLLWAFDIPINNPHVRERLRKRIEWELR